MKLLFIDPRCSVPYDSQSLQKRSLGGAQSSTIRIANALSRTHQVLVAQPPRQSETFESPRLGYIGLGSAYANVHAKPDVVVVHRWPSLVPRLRAIWPDARLYLWMHNYNGWKLSFYRSALQRARCGVITVSQTHCDATRPSLTAGNRRSHVNGNPASGDEIDVMFIHNPIDDALAPDNTPVDNNKLVFFSSPHKGLGHVLKAFARARRRMPGLQLYIANPGYYPLKHGGLIGAFAVITGGRWMPTRAQCLQEGVHILGKLPQYEALRHVREACCVFYPQTSFPETFGLVYAEANAVGTPVLAHDFGSAREILCSSEQLVDATKMEDVLDKLADWHQGNRPHVAARNELRLSNIVKHWEQLLATGRPGMTGQSAAKREMSTMNSPELAHLAYP